MKTSFFLALLMVASMLSYSQDSFEPAVLITSNGDTLLGFIDNQNWGTTPGNILFRKERTSAGETYYPARLSSFEITGKDRYVSRDVVLHYRTNDIRELEQMMDTVTSSGPIFLQVLYSGAANLYLFEDEANNKHFFIEKPGEKTVELEFRRMLGKTNNNQVYRGELDAVVTVERYKQTLSYLFADCPALTARIRGCSYDEHSLVNLFAEYSACRQVKGQRQEPENQKANIYCGVLAGFSATTLDISTDITYLGYLDQQEYNYSIRPSLGIRLFIEMPRNKKRYAIVNDLLYSSYNVEGSIENGLNGTVTNRFEMAYLCLHTQMHFDLNTQALRPYLRVGVGNSFLLSHTSSQETSVNNSLWYTEGIFGDVRTWEPSLLVSLGARKNRLQADATLKKGAGFSRMTGLSARPTSWFLLLSWFF